MDVRYPLIYGLFIVLSNTIQSHATQGIELYFKNQRYPLIINTRKTTPRNSIFLLKFLLFSLASSRPFGTLGFYRFWFLWEPVIREERFLIFMVGSSLVDTRSVIFGKQQKGKILIFRFCCSQGFRDEVPNKFPEYQIVATNCIYG